MSLHLAGPRRSSTLAKVRARALTPSRTQVDPDVRGFHPWEAGPSIVEGVGNAFLDGYEIACLARTADEALLDLGGLADQWRGFAAEGAGMAVTIRSRLEPHNRGLLRDFLRHGPEHSYLAHVGVGWAMARLPRLLWPDLHSLERGVVPLVLDGYGFHEVFFKTSTVLAGRGVPFPDRAWPGDPGTVRQHLAQGVGRGLWFVCGGSPTVLVREVGAFAKDVRASLWAGIGLAMTYAGGGDADAVATVLTAAGPHMPWVRQGSAFALEARARAHALTPGARITAETVCELPAEDVLQLVAGTRPAPSPEWDAYDRWRVDLAEALTHG